MMIIVMRVGGRFVLGISVDNGVIIPLINRSGVEAEKFNDGQLPQ